MEYELLCHFYMIGVTSARETVSHIATGVQTGVHVWMKKPEYGYGHGFNEELLI